MISIFPDLVIVRMLCRGVSRLGESPDFRNVLYGFMHAGIPMINSPFAVLAENERPIMMGLLNQVKNRVGKDKFPLIDQTFYSEPGELIFTPEYPFVLKVGYPHAGYGKLLIKEKRELDIKENISKLKSEKLKILIVAHPYITYDEMLGKDITDYLSSHNIEVIYSDKFNSKITNKLALKYSKDLYFKYNRDNIGALKYCENKIDGVIFLSAFPCGPDSLVNELVMRKIKVPYLNLVLDDNSSFAGFETRLESFTDMLGELYD